MRKPPTTEVIEGSIRPNLHEETSATQRSAHNWTHSQIILAT